MKIRLDYELAMRVASLLYGKKMRRRVYQMAIIAIIIITGSLFLFENSLRAATDESQKTLNKCETRNKTVFDTRLRHPETINSVPLNSVLRIKQIGV